MPRPMPTVILFAPEHWGQAERFSKLCGNSFAFGAREGRAVSGSIHHIEKAFILRGIVQRLLPNLAIDTTQLKTKGFTPADNSRDLAAVIEASFLEMYSALDCSRKVVVAIHKGLRGMPTNSTRKLFAAVQQGKLDGVLPAPLVATFKSADWYPELRGLRDELTHSDTGGCHLESSGLVTYMHTGLGNHERAYVKNDILGYADEMLDHVNTFVGSIFAYLNTLLRNEPLTQFCAISGGRMYWREVVPSEAMDFNSGVCASFQWFELPENPTCPFVVSCGAYKRARGITEE